jgi:hypothetical protein
MRTSAVVDLLSIPSCSVVCYVFGVVHYKVLMLNILISIHVNYLCIRIFYSEIIRHIYL